MDYTSLQKSLTPICPYCEESIEGTTPINGLHPECNKKLNEELAKWEKDKAA